MSGSVGATIATILENKKGCTIRATLVVDERISSTRLILDRTKFTKSTHMLVNFAC